MCYYFLSIIVFEIYKNHFISLFIIFLLSLSIILLLQMLNLHYFTFHLHFSTVLDVV